MLWLPGSNGRLFGKDASQDGEEVEEGGFLSRVSFLSLEIECTSQHMARRIAYVRPSTSPTAPGMDDTLCRLR
jgi:hypothetical protein